ncbi:uncharacterized protein LOC134820686 [Bolinopsis microptera]|uniref:uncharacterized protein LOC134820686 n=1 Tax=Bolinopsis microptera TaxID=2820187 RepID=UPI003078B242
MICSLSFVLVSCVILKSHLSFALTGACTMLPFDNYTELSCKVTGWYNDTKLPCNTYKAADEGDASFLYVPIGLTVTIFCPIRHILVGAGQYDCEEKGFDPPIQLSNYTDKIDPHPKCLNVDEMQGALCDSDTLPVSSPHYKLYSDADYVFVDREYKVQCEAGYSTVAYSHSNQDRELYGVCYQSGKWEVTGSKCLGMCGSEVRHGGEARNTALLYDSYTDLQVTTQLDNGLHPVGTEVNVSITCEEGYSSTGSRSGEFKITCLVDNTTAAAGYYGHSRYETTVNCKRNCQVPTLREGKLIDPWTGLTLIPGTWTLKNSDDAARMRCPTGTYALGRVRIECYDGEITHPLPTCTREFQPCEAPLIEHGVRDPHNLAPADSYTLQCSPGFSLPVTVSPKVDCRRMSGKLTDLGVPAAGLSPAASYACYPGCDMPFTSLSHGTLHPIPTHTRAPYKVGQVITISCFNVQSPSLHECLWDGWDNELWPDCTPSSTKNMRLSGLLITFLILIIVLGFAD